MINLQEILTSKLFILNNNMRTQILEVMKEACDKAIDLYSNKIGEDSNNDYHLEVAEEIKKNDKMKGKEIIEYITKHNLNDIDIYVNFSFKNNSSYTMPIKNLSIECTNLNMFIDIGKIDNLINNDYQCDLTTIDLDEPKYVKVTPKLGIYLSPTQRGWWKIDDVYKVIIWNKNEVSFQHYRNLPRPFGWKISNKMMSEEYVDNNNYIPTLFELATEEEYFELKKKYENIKYGNKT